MPPIIHPPLMQKILVIDDEQPFREAVLELLEVEGFQAIGAENGQMGVQLAQEHLPDLVLCDIQMPDLDGYNVLRSLRQDSHTATTPFIFSVPRAAIAEPDSPLRRCCHQVRKVVRPS